MEYTQLPEFRDISWRHLAYAATTLILAATGFAFWHEIELKQDVPGAIVSQSEIKIQNLQGLVREIYVQPGQQVEAGTPLFRIEKDISLSMTGQQQAAFEENTRARQLATAELEYSQRQQEIRSRLDGMDQSIGTQQQIRENARQEVLQHQELLAAAEGRLERLETAREYVLQERIDTARAEVLQQRIALSRSQAQEKQSISELNRLQASRRELQTQLPGQDIARQKNIHEINARFERERQSQVISAPRTGIVAFANLLPGQMLREEDIAMVLSTGEAQPLMAALRIPSRKRGFIKEGQLVRLKLDAFPYTRFGSYPARISHISTTTVAPPSAPGAAAGEIPTPGSSEGEYVAWAILPGNSFTAEGRQYEILPGMSATASIVVEERTIAEWILAPIYRMFRN